MGNNELGIYDGCYVELRNGDVVGPVTRDTNEKEDDYIWDARGAKISWTRNGNEWHSGEGPNDIIRVIDPIKLSPKNPYAKFESAVSATIPPHVTTAAMEAGIKANPAYEQFVNAILTAGFEAQYGIEFVGVGEKPAIDMDALYEEISTGLKGNKGYLERAESAQEVIRSIANKMVAYFGRSADRKNESENRIQDSEKVKGGLSEIPSVVFPLKGYDLSQIGSALRYFLVGLGESRGATLKGVWLKDRHELEATFVDESGASIPVHIEVPKGFEFPWRSQETEKVIEPTIPSSAEIDETIRQCVTEWRKTDNGTAFTPPSRYIAGAIHKMLSDRFRDDF